MSGSIQPHWWQKGIVYQIYPRSFRDTNGDGVGDLEGIRAGLPYLSWLGVDAIWISPIFPSPMTDFGYDVADYCDIDPLFGSLSTFDALVRDAHQRGLKVILDYVPNHTSDQHPWFLEARRSRQSSKRDYYLWRDGLPDGLPPTNWLSEFGGPAWEWDVATSQYYYHAYLKTQPDLNWRNPAVRAEMLKVLTFWLDRGVDGFRVDTVHHLIKDDLYRNNPTNPAYTPDHPPHRALLRTYTTDRPEVHQAISDMRAVLDRYEDRVLIGEAYLPVDRLVTYYGVDLGGMHLPFNFQLIQAHWQADFIAGIVQKYEAALPRGAWPNWVLGNHDRSRVASRVGPRQARVAALLLLTLRGTPTLYYGDEIGMRDLLIPPHLIQDPWEKNVPGKGLGRDPERTPMLWSAAPHSGFSSAQPWLPVSADFERCNVESQKDDPTSLLQLYRRLIALRRRHPALSIGDYVSLGLPPDEAAGSLCYQRALGDERFVVLLNLTTEAKMLSLPTAVTAGGEVVLSTHPERVLGPLVSPVELAPDEGILVGLRQEGGGNTPTANPRP